MNHARNTDPGRTVATALLTLFTMASVSPFAVCARDLRVEIIPRFGDAPMHFDAVTHRITARRIVSVTRLDFLVSEIRLRSTNGSWVNLSNQFAYISTREKRTTFLLTGVPEGDYQTLHFNVGVPPEKNHQDPADFTAQHPLNPNVNGLHWSWAGGYVFLALEGNWLRHDGEQGGYSYHLATDEHLMTVELPFALQLKSDGQIKLALDVGKIFSEPNLIALSDATTSTHSRTNDPLAAQLRENIEHAFSVLQTGPIGPEVAQHAQVKALEIGRDAHPYRLTISTYFPRPALPEDNPLTEEGVELGRRLFFDSRLSINNSQSCASCHKSSIAFSEPAAVSKGAEGKAGTRNAMPLMNLAWKSHFFWDGRAASLREQVLRPIEDPIEMHESLSNVVVKLSAARSEDLGDQTVPYPTLFGQAFGNSQITADRIARALEQFLLVQTSHGSKFDRVLSGADTFSEIEQRGFELFHTEFDPRREQYGADCFHCHGGPLFQSQTFANNGLDMESIDLGRYMATGNAADKGKFATPSLRNVELTRPYMHDGRFNTLEQVLDHYSSAVKRSRTLDPNLAKHPDRGLQLSSADKSALVAFLKTLTDERFHTPITTLAATP
jgi:cytochrome c peroxidase